MATVPSRDALLRHLAVRAATSPFSLLLGTTGVLLVAHPSIWWCGAGALAAQGAWIWSRIRCETFARAGAQELLAIQWRVLVERLDALSSDLDGETAAVLNAITDAHERLLGIAPGEPALLPASRVEITSLLEQCLSLAERRQRLRGYLASVQTAEVQRQVRQLEARLDQTHDDATRLLLEQAVSQKQQELENYVRLDSAIERIDGQLVAVQCTFDNLLSRAVRLHSGAETAPAAQDDPVYQELNRLNQGVAALDASLNETLNLGEAV